MTTVWPAWSCSPLHRGEATTQIHMSDLGQRDVHEGRAPIARASDRPGLSQPTGVDVDDAEPGQVVAAGAAPPVDADRLVDDETDEEHARWPPAPASRWGGC